MSVLIIGSNGSMGRRYQAILKHLKMPMFCTDKDESFHAFAKEAKGIIVATPTETHFSILLELAKYKKPILCEKPLTKSTDELAAIKDMRLNLTMTMQYQMLNPIEQRGFSYYDYFRHGNDGLAWDCIQIIGLARGLFELHGESPVWRCILNGDTLSLGQMDKAYVAFVQRWLKAPGEDMDWLLEIHQKVMEYQNGKKR